MTDHQDWEQPPSYPQQGGGQQQPRYDPYAHQQRLRAWSLQGQQDVPQPPPWQPQPVTSAQLREGQKRKPWVARHKVLSVLIAFSALVVIIVGASGSNKPTTMVSDSGAASSSESPSTAVSSASASSAPTTPAAPASPSMTAAQQQAVDAADGYLSEGQGFSEQGLLSQLTSSAGEGYSQSDAEFAIDYVNPNWDQQAVDAANGYLSEGQGFSEQGLLQQLTSSAGDGFTGAQAEYAINSLNPNWDAQAVDAAKSYMQMGGFSQASLIQQLKSSAGSGFTQAQAEYAASQVGL
jgi:hypothetical protein